MRQGALRWTVVVVLLGAAVGTALFVNGERRRAVHIGTLSGDTTLRLDGIAAALETVIEDELRYLTLGVPRGRTTPTVDLVATAADTVASLRSTVLAPNSTTHLDAVVTASQAVMAIHSRAREYAQGGELLMAADLVLTDGRSAVQTLRSELDTVRTDEARAAASERDGALDAASTAVGGLAVLWSLGLLFLARIPRVRSETAVAAAAASSAGERPRTDEIAATPPGESATPRVDLVRAAALCTDLARATTTTRLTELLSSVAATIEAPGLIVWLRSGDELFAALGVGYDPRIVARLGTIRSDADNATAVAWRTSTMQTVAGDMVSRGAIVAPLVGPDGCIGALAVEVPHGKDSDPNTRALATLFAAQLATALALWPTAAAVPDAAGAPVLVSAPTAASR